ncbi:MAG TPA: hypothetical protein VGO11_03630 [Chthoniobacteraceae bacterium]|jgi:uncharacterized membrane protein|nr:hypothetical protein [Chthoniobacteraceae bacterium]
MSSDPHSPPEDPLGPPPQPPPVEAPFEQVGATEGTGLPRNIAAALACIFPFIGGIVFYFLDRRDRFVRFYALQSIVLGVVYLVACIAFDVSIFIFHRVPVLGWFFAKAYLLASLALCVLWLCLIWNAYKGKTFELPVLWKVAKRYIPQVFL